jgi:hypothetical protein
VQSTLARLNHKNSFLSIMLASESATTLRQGLALANAKSATEAVAEALKELTQESAG